MAEPIPYEVSYRHVNRRPLRRPDWNPSFRRLSHRDQSLSFC